MFSSKKPKFSLDLSINELSNIPQISGHCFFEIQIKDSKRLKSGFGLKHPLSEKTSGSDSKINLFGSTGDISDTAANTTSSSGHISVRSTKKKIHNFKCVFNYHLSCNLKFPLKRRENLIGDKYLSIRVFFINDDHSSHGHTSELGRLHVNLSEYLNFDKPTTSKYLLHDSKINSILSLTVDLKELPSDYDFHTQLQIDDAASHDSEPTKKLSKNHKSLSVKASGAFNVPQFEKKKTFGGLNDVIHSPNSDSTTFSTTSQTLPSASSFSSEESRPTRLNHDKPSRSLSTKSSQKLGRLHSEKSDSNLSFQSNANTNNEFLLNIIMDPIISNLYKKILESTWDPELHSMLEYSPEKCINDIFNTNADEFEENLNKRLSSMRKESSPSLNGLISEENYRDDLRSWSLPDELKADQS